MFSFRSSFSILRISQYSARRCRNSVAGNAKAKDKQSIGFHPQMRAWAVNAFNTPLSLVSIPKPTIQCDDQVIIRVKAVSVNPIDVLMSKGYGNEVLSKIKRLSDLVGRSVFPTTAKFLQALQIIGSTFSKDGADDQFPLILGRDCSGEVVEKGRAVKDLDVGDQVMVVVPPHCRGCHSEYAVSFRNAVALKPALLSHTESAALPYVACTAWAALVTTGRIDPKKARHLRVLIHGGAGGVGTMAIQMLRCWGVEKVVATCSAEKMKLVEELGAKAVDYRAEEAKEQLLAEGPFELVLDCVSSELAEWSDELLGIWRSCVHVSVNSPFLRDTDRYGLSMGLASAGVKLINRNLRPILKGRVALPAFFAPNSDCLHWVSESVEQGQLRPVIDEVFPFYDLPKAYEKVGQMHGKGKTVVDFDGIKENSNGS